MKHLSFVAVLLLFAGPVAFASEDEPLPKAKDLTVSERWDAWRLKNHSVKWQIIDDRRGHALRKLPRIIDEPLPNTPTDK